MTPADATSWVDLVRDGGLAVAVVVLGIVVAYLYRENRALHEARR